MLERIRKVRRDQRGFTLIELIMVLVILGILLALALPAYLGTRRKAYLSEAQQNLQEMRTAAWLIYVEKGEFSAPAQVATSPNWTYAYGNCTGTTCAMSATNDNLAGGGAASVTVTLSSNGTASVTSSGF